jgi:hypothetical protein
MKGSSTCGWIRLPGNSWFALKIARTSLPSLQMTLSLLRLSAAAGLFLGATACTSSLPTAEQMDAYEKDARAEYRAAYAELDRQRAEGLLTQEQYQFERSRLDQRVRNAADTKAWGRHALVQSEMKANYIPTPDQPVDLRAPGASSIPNSMYNTPRNNPMTGQQSSFLGTGATY